MASGATFDDLQQKMKFTNIVRSVKSKERSGNMVRARSTSSSNGAPASCGVTNEQVGSAAHRSAAWPEYVLYTAPALAVNGSIAPWALPSTSLAVSSRSLVASMGSGLRHEKVGRGGGRVADENFGQTPVHLRSPNVSRIDVTAILVWAATRVLDQYTRPIQLIFTRIGVTRSYPYLSPPPASHPNPPPPAPRTSSRPAPWSHRSC